MRSSRNILATGTVLFLFPLFALASGSPGARQTEVSANGQAEATRMVAANADLLHPLNAKKAHPGEPVQVKLRTAARLTNGTVLPSGTMILGRIVKTDAYPGSQSKLALNFNQAELRDGKTLPIKATIVGVYGPEFNGVEGYPVTPGNQVPVEWSDRTVQVDQVNALPGVDLHSSVAGGSSGILVSDRKDVELRSGSEIQLAIAPRTGAAS